MCGIPDLAIAIHQDTACQWIFISICAWRCCVRFSVAAMMAMMIGDPCFNLRGLDQWIKWNGCTTFTLWAARAGGDQAGKTLSQVAMRPSGWPGAAIGPLRITHPLLLAEEARHWRWWGQLMSHASAARIETIYLATMRAPWSRLVFIAASAHYSG